MPRARSVRPATTAAPLPSSTYGAREPLMWRSSLLRAVGSGRRTAAAEIERADDQQDPQQHERGGPHDIPADGRQVVADEEVDAGGNQQDAEHDDAASPVFAPGTTCLSSRGSPGFPLPAA